MATKTYRFTDDYASSAGSWTKGTVVALDEETAAWLNQDVPGIVKESEAQVDHDAADTSAIGKENEPDQPQNPAYGRVDSMSTVDVTVTQPPAEAETDPEKMTREELNEYARQNGIADPEAFTSKDALLATVQSHINLGFPLKEGE